MSVDMFGRSNIKSTTIRGPPGIGYKLTQDGHYNINNKRLCNLGDPLHDDDAVSLHILKKRMTDNHKNINEDIIKHLESLENSILEKISAKFKIEIEKLTLKLDSNTSLIIKVINDLQNFQINNLQPIYGDLGQLRNDLENLTNKISLLTNKR